MTVNVRPLRRGDPAIGILVLCGFGAVWYALADLLASPTVPAALAAAVPGAVVLALLLRAALRFRASERSRAAVTSDEPASEERRAAIGRRFAIVNVLQWVAIVLAIVAANALHVPERILNLVELIVGLHFFPLARLFGAPEYNVTAAAMCVAALAGFALRGDAGALFATASACAILWATAAYVLMRSFRTSPRA
jgi:hypothetical protein